MDTAGLYINILLWLLIVRAHSKRCRIYSSLKREGKCIPIVACGDVSNEIEPW